MDTMASQITSLTIVNSAVYSSADEKKQTPKLRRTGLCVGNSPGTGEDRDRNGCGILLYMYSDIPHRRRYDLEPETLHGIEIMIIETRLYKAVKWFLVSFYESPTKSKSGFLRLISLTFINRFNGRHEFRYESCKHPTWCFDDIWIKQITLNQILFDCIISC